MLLLLETFTENFLYLETCLYYQKRAGLILEQDKLRLVFNNP
jgi:hypothetical protein